MKHRGEPEAPQLVIAAYRPRPGKEARLLEVVREHLPVLRAEGLVTDRPPVVMRAADGTIIEVFEWRSAAAIDEAHRNPAVQALWVRFGEACDYESLVSLEECRSPFAAFEPVDL